ncbi:hypothetical protein HPB47_022865 [Ixodes persulcatus]|uniref:Uncharacterized protein n=1 Tax=Ixodes persulcatus TaxID=34615 RepID=A0AC60Q8F8_IXOPE|nr:hypothetical protein HPB47_022865 [Ixodes persulcatus]
MGLRGFALSDPRPHLGERPRDIEEYLRRPLSPVPTPPRGSPLAFASTDHQLPPSSGPGAISKKEHHYWRSRQDCVSGPRRRGLHYGIGGQRLDAALVEPSKEKTGPPSSLKIGPPSYFVVAELPLTRCRPTPARNARVYSSDIIFVPDYSEERAASVIQRQSLTLR